MSGTPTFGRYAEIPVDQMTPEPRAGYRDLVDGPRGRPQVVYEMAMALAGGRLVSQGLTR